MNINMKSKSKIKKVIVFIPIIPVMVIEWVFGHIYEGASWCSENYLAYWKKKIDK